MSGRLWDSSGARGLVAVLLFVALAIRLVIPAGYMPTETPRGLVISLCTAEGVKKSVVMLPASGQDSDHGLPGDKQTQPCAFASLSAAAIDPGTPPSITPAPLPLREIALPPPAETGSASLRYLQPPSRGPPAAA